MKHAALFGFAAGAAMMVGGALGAVSPSDPKPSADNNTEMMNPMIDGQAMLPDRDIMENIAASPMHFDLSLPGLVGSAILSPDGKSLAYGTQPENGKRMLSIRPIGSATGQPIAGTENINGLLWSPDSRRIAFVSDGTMKIIDLASGSSRQIGNVGGTRGGSWNSDDRSSDWRAFWIGCTDREWFNRRRRRRGRWRWRGCEPDVHQDCSGQPSDSDQYRTAANRDRQL